MKGIIVVAHMPDGSKMGLRQGKLVPVARATVHPDEYTANAMRASYESKCFKRKTNPPKMEIAPWKN